MKKAFLIIAIALIWGIVIIACSIALQDTEAYQDIQLILGGGAAVSMLVVAVFGKQKKTERGEIGFGRHSHNRPSLKENFDV